MTISPLTTIRKTSNQLFKLTDGDTHWLLKRYQGEKASHHRNSEKQRLELWLERNYQVPEVIDLDLPEEKSPYLVMQWLDGQSLGEFLQNQEIPLSHRLNHLVDIITDFHSRQIEVQQHNDLTMIHHDPNSGNLFITESGFYYLDFEDEIRAGSKSLMDHLAIELSKLIRWSTRDLGRSSLPDVARRTVDIYGSESDILRRIIHRVHNMPFQAFQRFKDHRKKKRDTEEITKFDIADAFKSLIG